MLSSGCRLFDPPPPNIVENKFCRDWQDWLIEKGDVITDGTGKRIIANNEARAVWCQPKKA